MSRLPLPGPRRLWWWLSALGICLPLTLIWSARPPSDQGRTEALQMTLRTRNAIWRMTDLVVTDSAGLPGDATASGQVQAAALQEMTSLLEQYPSASDQELILTHLMVTGQQEMATDLLPRVEAPSRQLRAAITTLGKRPAHGLALPATEASDVAKASDFGASWGPFTRETVRAKVHALAGRRDLARESHAKLQESRETHLPLLYSVVQIGMFALIFGAIQWLLLGFRRARARKKGEPQWQWLTSKHPGLDHAPVFPTDPLFPWLAFAAWMLAYLLGGLLIQSLPGERSAAGLAVLFQSLFGVVTAAGIIAAFSRTAPTLDAARLRPAATAVSPLRASTAALWVYAVMLPVVAGAALFNAALSGLTGADPGSSHPVAAMLLGDVGPIELVALGVAVSIAAPLGEELIFRGLLFQGLRQHVGTLRAAALSALLFALVHGSGSAMMPYWVLGFAFAMVFQWTGSLWASVILHGLWNLAVFLGMLVFAQS